VATIGVLAIAEPTVWFLFVGRELFLRQRPSPPASQVRCITRSRMRAGNVHSADGWESVLKPVVSRYCG
jgi:hypothetical protein